MNIVEKRGDIARRNKFYLLFDGKVAEGHLSDVIDSTLGYALTYYHTIDGNMYKEWMNEKRTKKDFHIKNDNERRIWVYLSDRKNEEEVKPLNLMMDESDEFNEVWRSESWRDEWLSSVFHHYHGIQSHVDTGWETQDSQSHRWSIGTPSYHSQGSYRWLVEWLSEMVQKCRRGTRDGRK